MASQEREKKKRVEEKEGEKRKRSEEGEEEDRGKAPMLDIAAKRKRDEDDEGDQDQRGEDIIEIMEVMCEDDVEDYKDAEMEEEIGDDYGGQPDQAWADMDDDIKHQEEEVYDDLTGKILKYEKVIEARIDEIKALVKMGVWETVPLASCLSRTQRRPIRARWVDIDKGDDKTEVYR